MNTEHLYDLAKKLVDHYSETAIIELLDNLIIYLNTQDQQSIAGQIEIIEKILQNAPSKNYDIIWKNTMDELGFSSLYGDSLLRKIHDIFQRNQITPQIAVNELTSIKDTIAQLNGHMANLVAAFVHLNIDGYSLRAGKCEVSIRIPRKYVGNRMDKLGAYINKISKTILPPITETYNESGGGFQIKGLASSDPIIMLAVAPVAAYAILKFVDKSLSIYKKMLEINRIRNENALQDYPEIIEQLKSEIDKNLASEVKKAVQAYISDAYKSVGEHKGRTKSELENRLTHSMKELLNIIDAGGSIHVRGEVHIVQQNDDGEQGEAQALSEKQEQENAYIEKVIKDANLLDYQNTKVPQISHVLSNMQSEGPDPDQDDKSSTDT